MSSIRSRLGLDDRATLPMTLILFLICFTHCLVRNMKDSLVITAQGATTEVIPFIQLWMMLPATLLATYAFTKLANRCSRQTLFYSVLSSFLVFFALFTFVLFPLRHSLHLHDLADSLNGVLSPGWNGLIAMIRNWTLSLFFTVSELWACMVTSVLFWSFANEITPLGTAKRSYGFYTLGGNLGATVSGLIPPFIAHLTGDTPVYVLMSLILTACLAIMGLFYWLTTYVLIGDQFASLQRPGVPPKLKSKIPLMDSFREVLSSSYLLCLALIVLLYNLLLSFGELVWKDQLRTLYPTFQEYNAYLGYATVVIGLGSLVLAAFMSRIFDRLGWTKTALICPIAMLVTSLALLGVLQFGAYLPLDSSNLLGLVVLLGASVEISGRMTKHSVQDATKDMAFIPLAKDLKLRGKAAIDGTMSRFGRSVSAVACQVFIICFGGIAASIPAVGLVFAIGFITWIWAVKSLGRQFEQLLMQTETCCVEADNMTHAAA